MNLLTDLIRDVASEINVQLTDDQEMALQKEVFAKIIQEVAWIKQAQVKGVDFPWLEKPKIAKTIS